MMNKDKVNVQYSVVHNIQSTWYYPITAAYLAMLLITKMCPSFTLQSSKLPHKGSHSGPDLSIKVDSTVQLVHTLYYSAQCT